MGGGDSCGCEGEKIMEMSERDSSVSARRIISSSKLSIYIKNYYY
jgi:hypothetical protein